MEPADFAREFTCSDLAFFNVMQRWFSKMDERDDGNGRPLSAGQRATLNRLRQQQKKEVHRLAALMTGDARERQSKIRYREANRLRMRLARAAEPKEPITKKCAQCGEQFEAKRSTALFCSDKCRVYHNREQGSDDKQSVTKRSARSRTR